MSGNDHHAAWEEHYSAKPQVWSGRVNTQLAAIAPQLGGGRALDLWPGRAPPPARPGWGASNSSSAM